MSDDALIAMLDREGTSAAIKEHFEGPLSLIDELVNYGTNLGARAFGSSPADFKATYLLFVHLQQFVAHLDAAAVLLRQGCCLSASLPLRSLLESYLTLKWILASDTDSKIEHIFVTNLRRRKRWQSIAVPGTPEASLHADAASRLPIDQAVLSSVAAEIARIDEVLAAPERVAINAAFETFLKKRKREPHWYELCGASSIRQIAGLVGQETAYSYIYSPFSAVSHGSDVWKSVIFRKDQLEINPIRNSQEVPLLCSLGCNFALDVYRLILTEYRFAELENFRRKFREDWRERFVKKFNINVQPLFTSL